MTRVANARMYTVDAAVAAHWRTLLTWVAERSGVALDVVEHPPPASLRELWQRPDLGAAAMCGYPLATWPGAARPVPIVAPVPAFAGHPIYWTDIVARADAPYGRDDDLAGARFGWTLEDSQSGYQAPRRHFAQRALARGGAFFGSTIGPLATPRRVVESIIDGAIDAGPLDAYWHALLRRHEPRTAARLRVIATTEPTPIPCFVAAAATPPDVRERLASTFAGAERDAALQPTLAALALAGFARIDAAAYDVLAANARDTDTMGYARLR